MSVSTDQILVSNSVLSPLGGIRLAGVVHNGLGVLVPSRVLDRYALVYVLSGNGIFTDEHTSETPLRAGDLIQVLPNVKHWYGPLRGTTWDEIYIDYEGRTFDLWHEEGCFKLDNQVTHLEPVDYWRERFLKAAGHSNQGDALSALSEPVRIQSLLYDINKATQIELPENSDWLARAKTILATATSSQEAAAKMGLSYEGFRKKFRKLYGMAPGRYHAKLQMERACELLSQDTPSIREVAAQLDFCDEFHFSKQFNKIIGCSPSAYRARARSQLLVTKP